MYTCFVLCMVQACEYTDVCTHVVTRAGCRCPFSIALYFISLRQYLSLRDLKLYLSLPLSNSHCCSRAHQGLNSGSHAYLARDLTH